MSAVDSDLFKPELVFFDFEASDRFDFFEKMSKILTEGGYVKESWLDAIETREKNYPTGLAFEDIAVAIPHVDPENLVKPYIAVIKPKNPIVFEGMAGIGGEVPAQLIVNLGLLAHAEGQVAVLQALMGIFSNKDAVAEIMAQDTAEGIINSIVSHCE